MDVSAVDHRILVWLRDAATYPDNPVLNASDVAPYFPGGCPDTAPTGWPRDQQPYDDPHSTTVCPTCIGSWRTDHLVSDPVRVPAGAPLMITFAWTAERTRAHVSPAAG
ncbi:hypothetical protein [Frankia sp. Cj3]|uniref:hypothetical protein n=1 Tax=Frankia sp. Cj3 TaxID=2880976 RepID=UPI001EF540E0|nr:hypothetical protein [Frankia sp. Cj3]